MPSFEQQIAQRVQAFVSEITELARQQALETLSSALVIGGGSRARSRNGAEPVRRSRGRSTGRRSPEELDRACELLTAEIKANPGQRVEQIGRALGTPTKELALPLRKLLATKVLRSEGHRRATRYFPAGGRGAKAGRGKGRGRGGKRKAAAADVVAE